MDPAIVGHGPCGAYHELVSDSTTTNLRSQFPLGDHGSTQTVNQIETDNLKTESKSFF